MSVPQIPGFRIQKLLSEGRRSVLYLAEQQSLQRPVALKILTGEMSADEQSRKRLIEQEKSAARLTHPNILAVFDIGENEGRYYIATEYVTGGTLRDRLNRKSVSPEQALAITRDLAQGLSFLHEQGFLHRDIKPSNILFREDGTAVLGDTGIAKMEDAAQMEVSFGSPHYMSPEQAQSQPCDGRSDLYSLGVVLFEMLAARPPFDADDPFQVAIKHISEVPPPLPTPLAKLQPLVSRLLAKLPGDRFTGAGQLVQVLEQALSKLGPKTGPSQPQATTVMAAQVDPRATMVVPPTDPRATMVVPPTDPRATMVVPPADPRATMIVPPADPRATMVVPPTDPRATVVAPPVDPRATAVLPQMSIDATTVAQPLPAMPMADQAATMVSRPIDPGATTVQKAVDGPPPLLDSATVFNPPPIAQPPIPDDPTTVRMNVAQVDATGHLISTPEPRKFEVPRFEEEKPKSKAWIWILLVVLLVGGGFAGWWFLIKNKQTPTIIVKKEASQLGGSTLNIADAIKKSDELAKQGDWVGAISELKMAYDAESTNPQVIAARGAQLRNIISAAASVMAEGKFSTASAIVDAALTGYPDDPELRKLKAELDSK